MAHDDKRSFFERLTGATRVSDYNDEMEHDYGNYYHDSFEDSQEDIHLNNHPSTDWMEEDASEGELTIDMYQTHDDIIIKTIVAGVSPQDLDISITREMVTVRGHREIEHGPLEEDYFYQELYWGSFSRSVVLPQEIDVESSEALEKNGLLVIRLPKLNKAHETKLQVKSS